MSGHVLIFDTTLRDGEQSPGASMNIPDKLRMAEALADLGVDIIEAGFPIASPGDFEAVRAVARNIDGPIIAGLARCDRKDIERAWEAVSESDRPRLHVFLATSSIHREHKLKMAKEEILRRAAESVEFARSLCDDVEFSPEDASRTELDFLDEVVRCALQAGATTINIPDTVGYAVPNEFGERIAGLRDRVKELAGAVLSVHCHDDLGLAVANTVAALRAGARQVECTINGIGERAGNCSLEEVVMALRTRSDFFELDTQIDATKLYPTSQLLSNITGLAVQRNKAIVGDNAFAHEAGIHQHGMLMHHSTYEIMRPEDVGVGASNLVLGKHSGRHAFRSHVEEMGFKLDEEQLVEVFTEFKKLADVKRTVYDADIRALIDGSLQDAPHFWGIVGFQTIAGKGIQHVAEVRLEHRDGEERQEAACGDGPVDSLFKAMDRAAGVRVELHDYNVRSVTQGKDAQGEVTIETIRDGRLYRGRAVSTDVIEASADAYMSLINQVLAAEMSTLATPTRKEAQHADAC